ncbi:MAG: class I SAM-dependent methyltransferase [Chloroflexi bacterium]|nr:class I SAM-dependent methyltransferase [Chloroflexota bacterium]
MKTEYNNFDYSKIQGIHEVALRIDILKERLLHLSSGKQKKILEVGVGAGDVTLMLARQFEDVTCVDSSDENCRLVLQRLTDNDLRVVKFLQSRIEDAELAAAGYDHIVLLGVLEHLEDPVGALRHLEKYVCADGCIHIAVNLANSLHRWLGVDMGIISKIDELGESDIKLGHYRVYTLQLLRQHLKDAGLSITYERPFYLKPLPTSMMTSLPMEIHKGLFLLGERFPEFASYIYMESM